MYRPYTKDPHSLAALDRKTKKELSDTKEGYEEEIKKINKVFSQKDYDLNKKKKEKIHEVEKAFKSLKEEFNKLKKQIQIKKRYFIWKNFFGGIKSATEVQYAVCERSDLSNSVIKKLEILTSLVNKYNCSRYNQLVVDYTAGLISSNRIPHRNRPYDVNKQGFVKTHNFNPSQILNDAIKTDATNFSDSEVYDKIFHPKKIYGHDKGWTEEAEEVDKEYFSQAKDSMTAKVGFLIGDFFKNFNLFPFVENFEEIINEDVFRGWKIDLLNHMEKYSRKATLNLRSKDRNKKLSENLNSVYVMTNPSYKNAFKIGWTSLSPEERADQLSSETGVLHPFKVVFKKKFKDAEKIEKKIHRKFSNYRIKRNKEYFEIGLDKIKDYIKSI